MTDWERFVNDDGRSLPPLIQAALMHYQFETIHPFLDGNGRIGRLLINVLLMERQRLSEPLLYLSHYFETHRDEYYAALQDVREAGNIDGWFRFFLRAVREQADDAVARARALIQLRESYLSEASRSRSNLTALVEIIMRNPYVTAHSVQVSLGMTNQGARNLIRAAEGRGWLVSLGAAGRGGRQQWYAPEVLQIMDAPMRYPD